MQTPVDTAAANESRLLLEALLELAELTRGVPVPSVPLNRPNPSDPSTGAPFRDIDFAARIRALKEEVVREMNVIRSANSGGR